MKRRLCGLLTFLLLPVSLRPLLPGLLHLLAHGLHDPLFPLLKNGPDGLRDVLLQGRAPERLATRRLFCLRCLRLRGLWRLFLLGLLRRLLQLGDHRMLLYLGSNYGTSCTSRLSCGVLARRLSGLWLLPSLSLWPGLLPRLPGLRDP